MGIAGEGSQTPSYPKEHLPTFLRATRFAFAGCAILIIHGKIFNLEPVNLLNELRARPSRNLYDSVFCLKRIAAKTGFMLAVLVCMKSTIVFLQRSPALLAAQLLCWGVSLSHQCSAAINPLPPRMIFIWSDAEKSCQKLQLMGPRAERNIVGSKPADALRV